MNEPASWVSGDVVGCADNLINHPPYTPGGFGSLMNLEKYESKMFYYVFM